MREDHMEQIENTTISKVLWRLIPFLITCYFVAYLDRVNVGFAKLQMASALGLSEGSVKNLGRYAASRMACWPKRPSSTAALT